MGHRLGDISLAGLICISVVGCMAPHMALSGPRQLLQNPVQIISTQEGLISGLVFESDGDHLISAGSDGTVRLWDLSRRQEVARFEGHEDAVVRLAISPDGRLLASGSQDGTVRLWDVASRNKLHRFDGLATHGSSVAFSGDGRRLATTDVGGTRIWDLNTYRQVSWLEENRVCNVDDVRFTRDGKRVLTVLTGEGPSLWDVSNSKRLAHFPVNTFASMWSADISPDGSIIVGGSGDGLRTWDASTAKLTFRIQPSELGDDFDFPGVVIARFSPDGKSVVTAGGHNALWIWDVRSMTPLLKLHGGVADDRADYFTAASFSPDGFRVAAASTDRRIWVWNLPRAPAVTRAMDR